jgi:hypothetical protein
MASNAKKNKRIRARKKRPNKGNLKANQKRIQRNTEILAELAADGGKSTPERSS